MVGMSTTLQVAANSLQFTTLGTYYRRSIDYGRSISIQHYYTDNICRRLLRHLAILKPDCSGDKPLRSWLRRHQREDIKLRHLSKARRTLALKQQFSSALDGPRRTLSSSGTLGALRKSFHDVRDCHGQSSPLDVLSSPATPWLLGARFGSLFMHPASSLKIGVGE